jgi:hypothetical protein
MQLVAENNRTFHTALAWQLAVHHTSPTGDCDTANTMVASMERSPHSATKISVATCTKACQADFPPILPLASAESIESRAPSSSPPPSVPSGVSQASCSRKISSADRCQEMGRPKVTTPDDSPGT